MCTRRRVDSRAPLCRAAAPHVPNARSFEGEGFTPTMERHCVNSASISFDKLPLPDGLAEEKVRRHTVEMLRGFAGAHGISGRADLVASLY